MPDTINEDFQEGQVAIHTGVLQTTNQAANEASITLQEAHHQIRNEILNDALTKRARVRLQALEVRIGNILGTSYAANRQQVEKRLTEIANISALGTQRNLQGVLGVDIDFPVPDAATVQGIMADLSMQGLPLRSWWETQPIRLQAQYAQVLRNGVLTGKTSDEIVRILEGRGDGKPILQGPTHEIRTLVNTSTNSAGNLAMLAFYEANDDVIRALQHLSTFDERTSDICIARANKIWNITGGTPVPVGHALPFRVPPLHGNCRSLLTAVTKSWEQLSGKKLARDERTFEEAFEQNLAAQGKTKAQIAKAKAGMRASMDGEIPRERTMDDFIQAQPGRVRRMIGPSRAQLYLDREIELGDLVDSTGARRTVEELRQLVDARDEAAEQLALIERAERAREEARQLESRIETAPGPKVNDIRKAPATKDEYQNWQVKKGQGGTRENIRWEMTNAQKEAGSVMIELDPEELRLQHSFTGLSQAKLDRLLEQDPEKLMKLDMPTVTLGEEGLEIITGQHRTLYANHRELDKILVAVSETDGVLRQIAAAKKAKQRRKRVKIPAHPLGQHDLIAWMANTKMRSRAAYKRLNGKITQKRKRGLELNSEEKAHLERYHGAPVMGDDISSQYRDIYTADITKGRLPDQLAQDAFDLGYINAPTGDALFDGIREAAQVRKVNSIRAKRRQGGDWDDVDVDAEIVAANKTFRDRTVKRGGEASRGNIYLSNEIVEEGDMFQVDGEVFTVNHVGPDGMVMHDGRRYPEVTLKPGERFRTEHWISQSDELGYRSLDDRDHEAFLTLLPELQVKKNVLEGSIQKLATTDTGIAAVRIKALTKDMKKELKAVEKQIREVKKLAPPTPDQFTVNTTHLEEYNQLLLKAQNLEAGSISQEIARIFKTATPEEVKGLASTFGLSPQGTKDDVMKRLGSIVEKIQRGEFQGIGGLG